MGSPNAKGAIMALSPGSKRLSRTQIEKGLMQNARFLYFFIPKTLLDEVRLNLEKGVWQISDYWFNDLAQA